MATKLDVKHYFDKVAMNWDSMCHHDINKLKKIVYIADIKPNDKVIDIACGTGVLTEYILEHNPSYLLGVDISERMIDIARSKFTNDRVEFLASDFFDIKYDKFDLAIIYSAYPHFLDKEQLVKKLHNILTIKGRFLIAHSESKEAINSVHNMVSEVANISTKLDPIEKEKIPFMQYFDIDIMIDTNDLYILSGTKKIKTLEMEGD